MTSPSHPVAPVPNAKLLLDGAAIDRILRRIASEIIERHNDALERLVLVGIPSRGVEISRRLVEQIRNAEGKTVESGIIDVSMHRDDLQLRPRLSPLVASHLPPDLSDRTLVLVDDVLFSGRTCRAAMDAISSFGRPARIEYAVLIDRGHRELPIRADYIGKKVSTRAGERVFVRFHAVDQVGDAVWVSQSLE
ncbi:MAG TPA: bifunctional pyr operon transcriptional regulator/uracil phosphoribosyltransferase PyrR [Chthoniobacteraceae bacterium]|nr:bifunctional pyr operon transcriptional regulator/uracil phosphoribosyltransferase PyrR [Chthoniobacteraceae bacterium]